MHCGCSRAAGPEWGKWARNMNWTNQTHGPKMLLFSRDATRAPRRVIRSQTHQCIQGRRASSWLCKFCNDMASLWRTMWETNYCTVYGESNSDFLTKYYTVFDWKIETSFEKQTVLMLYFLPPKDNNQAFLTASWKVEPCLHKNS